MKRLIALLLALAVILPAVGLVAAGCGEPTPEEARAQLETDLDSLETALTELANPTIYTSKDSFDEAADDIKVAFNDVIKSAKQVADIETEDLQDAWDQLEKAINSDKPLTEKIVDVQEAAENLKDAWQALVEKLDETQ